MDDFNAGSGLDGDAFYIGLSGITVLLIWLWVLWVVYKTWVSTRVGRLPEEHMFSAWLQSVILASVLTILVLV